MAIDTKNIKKNNIYNKYICDNSKNLASHFKNPFIDLIITSPPYWDIKKYGDIKEQTGHGQTYEEYLSDLRHTFQQVYNYSKRSATLFLIVDTIKKDGVVKRIPDDIATEFENIGWFHMDTIIWDKTKTLPWSRKGQMRNIFEYILMFTKDKSKFKYNINRIKTADTLKEWWLNYPERYSPKGKVPTNIWNFTIPTQGSWGKNSFGDKEFRHACPFPLDMMVRLIKLSSDPNDVVFDPYAGTGILLAAAQKLNRYYVGFDTNPEYKVIFNKVTKPLVNEKWIEVEAYYLYQNMLKDVMVETIRKLRILKYIRSLIRKCCKDSTFTDKIICDNEILMSVALERQLSKKEKINKNVISNVKYYIVLKHTNNINNVNKYMQEISSNPPFSKYGLVSEIEIIQFNQLKNVLENIDENLYYYINGDTKNYFKKTNALDEINKFVHDYKDEPLIISNIQIKNDDYKILLEESTEKYEKTCYIEKLKNYI